MNYILLIIFFVSICRPELKGQVAKVLDTTDILEWSFNRRLTIEDFKGTQDSSFLVYGSPANGAASTKLKAEFNYDDNNKLTVTITNSFFKSKSWMIVKKESVLDHEQGHFDISEIFARRMRREFARLVDKGETDKTICSELFNRLLEESKKYQDKYDKETGHGFDIDAQLSWDRKIMTELKYQEQRMNNGR